MIRTKVLGSGPLAGMIEAAVEGAPDMVFRAEDPDVTVVVGEDGRIRESGGVYLVVGPNDAGSMVAAVEAGARGYLAVNQPVAEMLTAIRIIGTGGASVPDELLGALLSHVVRRRRVREGIQSRLDTLTPRETEVFRAAARGLDKVAIGELLFISSETARTHLGRVRRKLGVANHAGLVALAAECGLDTTPMDST